MTPCTDIEQLLPAYLDGELAAGEQSDVETHIAECAQCAKELREESEFLQRVAKGLRGPPCPDALRSRIAGVLDVEDREVSRAHRRARAQWFLPASAALCAAAALLLFVATEIGSGTTTSPVTRDIVGHRFERTMPVIQTGSRPELSRAAREAVQIPVRPPRFAAPGVSLAGFQQSQVQGRPAAVFVYKVEHSGKQNSVHLYAFDASDLDLSGSERRVIDGREIWISQYEDIATVSYKDDEGVGYVFRSDMSPQELATLVEGSDLMLLVNRPPAAH